MAGTNKPEFAPLMAPGRHLLSIGELRAMCIDRFPHSQSRSDLFSRLETLVETIGRLDIAADIWINGSFVSEKENPDDIDLVLKIDLDSVNNLDIKARALIASIAQGNVDPKLDSYVFINYPLGHTRRNSTSDMWSYWAEQWSVARGGWCKGVAVLRLGESDVGLRLLT